MVRPTAPKSRAAQVRRFVALAVSTVSIWIVAPSAILFAGRFPQLGRVSIGWFLLVGALESLAFASMWELTRVALGTGRWFDIACAQLAGNALTNAKQSVDERRLSC